MPKSLSRRALVAAAAVLLSSPAMAAETKLVPAAKVFPFLESYLKLPAAERSRFTLAYRLTSGGKPVPGLKVWVVEANARTPLPIAADGRVGRLPTLAQLKSATLEFEAPQSQKFAIDLSVEPLVGPAAELDAGELAAAVAQASIGSKKAAGLIGFAVPRMECVKFVGVSGGVAVYADGRTAPLPTMAGAPVYAPSAWKGVKAVRFSTAPTRMMIGPSK
jgi:hypothetical protein